MSMSLVAQNEEQRGAFLKPSDTLNRSRRNGIVISGAAIYGVSMIGLSQLWYKDYEQSKFHTFNDNGEWMQMDKIGHTYSSYQLTRLAAETLRWSGVDEKKQLIYGAGSSLLFLTTVEVFDGYSSGWGFSWGDIVSNVIGSGFYVCQELLWQEQRLSFKYSFHHTNYANLRPETLGQNTEQQVFKDYNGQTYWLSVNLRSFIKNKTIPRWFNVALGYGADGMLTGFDEASDNIAFQDRLRQYYFSFDIDFTRIKTKSNVLRSVFSVLNTLKMPFPTFEIDSQGSVTVHPIYF